MADISQGNRAELILNPGDVYRVSTGGSATVEAVYGAPAGTTTVTASTQDFGPYAANAKLIVRAVTGSCSYGINQAVPLMARSGSLDDASRAALVASGGIFTKSALKIAVLGDSISEGQTARIPLPEADTGWFANCSDGVSTFLIAVNCAYGCAGGAAVLVDWDGVSKMRAQVAGDGYGAWVDVTGGGYFALQTGSGNFVFVKLRWRLKSAANTFSFTNQPVGTLTWCRQFSGDFFSGALAAANMQHHTILNYAIGGDWAADMLNRVGQVIACKPDAVLLMAGRNDAANSTDPTSSLIGILDALTAAGIYVMYVDTITSNYTAGTQVGAWVASANYMRSRIPTKYAGMVDIVDMALPYLNPTGASGSGLVDTHKFADNIHPSVVGTWGASAQLGSAALRARFPNAQWQRRVSGADAYNASTNPRGNLVGVRASMTGSTGTTSGTGVTTLIGVVPTNWVDAQQSGTFTAITYTEPSNASPIPRGGSQPGNWMRMVATNSSGATVSRYLYCDLETVPTAGLYYRIGITLRLSNAAAMRSLRVFLSFSGVANLAPSLIDIGASLPINAATLPDSGVMVLVSEPYKIPVGVASARLYIQSGCSNGGGYTLDIADPWVAPA